MTMQRSDLMELGVEALTALANPGFVKRAQKDVAAGMLPALRQDADGTVHARFDDGIETSMAPGVSLRERAVVNRVSKLSLPWRVSIPDATPACSGQWPRRLNCR